MTGKAYLVGAGPGRADLITVRGLALLRRADVVIYDRLIARELLDEIPPRAERIFAGKQGHGRHLMSQAAINAALISRVRAGLLVVRLKGGDAFVFGRGGEECLALAAAGLPFEIVPGVSAAIAAPAYAGIPVTHRGMASAFAVIAGHEVPATDESTIGLPPDARTPGPAGRTGGNQIDWSLMAQTPTLVVMMGVRSAASICATLVARGRGTDSPAAAISHATTDLQRVVRSTVSGLPQAMAEADIAAPAVLVFGEVAALHDQLDWFIPGGSAAGFVPLAEE